MQYTGQGWVLLSCRLTDRRTDKQIDIKTDRNTDRQIMVEDIWGVVSTLVQKLFVNREYRNDQ